MKRLSTLRFLERRAPEWVWSVAVGLLAWIGASPAIAEPANKPIVAVLELQDRAGVGDSEIRYFTDRVRGAAIEAAPGRHRVMTRENMLAMLPPGTDLATCEGECEIDTARNLGAHYVVSGDVLRVGKELRVSLKLHEVKSGMLLATEAEPAVGVEALDKSAATAARRLLRSRTSEPPFRTAAAYRPQVGEPMLGEDADIGALAAQAAEAPRLVAAAQAKLAPQVARDFAAIEGLVRNPTETGRPVLEAFVKKYGAAHLEVNGQRHALKFDEVGRVEMALGKSGMVLIQPGSFQMGSPSNESGRSGDEKQRTVRITRPFLIASHEVTQGEWKALMGRSPSGFTNCGDNCPVEQVSWCDAVEYANARSRTEGFPDCYVGCESAKAGCTGYRLPTEAEWEYAARAGTTSAIYGPLSDVAWYSDNSGGKTQPVGKKKPNTWGLYDMLGNVWEWTEDWYGDYAEAPMDGSPRLKAARGRVYRGGSWNRGERYIRAAQRDYSPGDRRDYLGFRLARTPSP